MDTLKAGDRVRKNTRYYVPDTLFEKFYTVEINPWKLCNGTLVVKLEGEPGCYAVDGLIKDNEERNKE